MSDYDVELGARIREAREAAAVTRHKPGAGLVEPCRVHGWNFIVRRGNSPVCRCEIAGP